MGLDALALFLSKGFRVVRGPLWCGVGGWDPLCHCGTCNAFLNQMVAVAGMMTDALAHSLHGLAL